MFMLSVTFQIAFKSKTCTCSLTQSMYNTQCMFICSGWVEMWKNSISFNLEQRFSQWRWWGKRKKVSTSNKFRLKRKHVCALLNRFQINKINLPSAFFYGRRPRRDFREKLREWVWELVWSNGKALADCGERKSFDKAQPTVKNSSSTK